VFKSDNGERMECRTKSDLLCVTGLEFEAVKSVSTTLESAVTETNLTMRFEPLPEELDFVSSAWNLVQGLIAENQDQNRDPRDSSITPGNPSNLPVPYKSAEELFTAFSRTLTARSNHDKHAAFANVDAQSLVWFSHHFRDRIYRVSALERLKYQLKEKLAPPLTLCDFQSDLVSTCSWRRFFITTGGYMGVGPPSMRVDDQIVVLFGSCVPFVVRKESSNDSCYSVVGECYVHGIMDGELAHAWSGSRAVKKHFEFI